MLKGIGEPAFTKGPATRNTIKATVRNRHIELSAPDDLLDGTEVLVDVTPLSSGKIGLDGAE